MKTYRICVIGGHCGVRMIVVAEHLQEMLRNAGYICEVTHQSLWDHLPLHTLLIWFLNCCLLSPKRKLVAL